MTHEPAITTTPPAHDGAEPSVAVLARRLAILDAVTTAIAEALDLPDLLDRALATVLEVAGVDGGSIFLVDEITADLRLAVHRGVGHRIVASFTANPGDTLRAMSADPHAPVVVQEFAPGRHRPEIAEERIRSYAGVPLHVRGQVLGILVAISRTTADFLAGDVELLVSVGRQIGVAIERARLVERERRRAQQLETINEVARRLGAIRTRGELLPQVVRYVRDKLGYDAATLLMLDGHHLVIEAACGLGAERLVGDRIPVDERTSLAGWVVAHDEPLLTNDVSREPRHLAAGGREQAELLVPIHQRSRIVGVLEVQSVRPNVFHPSDLSVLQTLARQIGVAIENARLAEETERSLRRTQAFQSVTAAMTASLDLRTTLERALDLAMEVFEADRAAVFLAEPGGTVPTFAAIRNLSPAYVRAVHEVYAGMGNSGPIETERSIYIEDAQAAPLVPALAEAARREGFHSMLFLPLRHGAEFLGTFVLYHDHIRRYADEESALAQTFAATPPSPSSTPACTRTPSAPCTAPAPSRKSPRR